MEYPHAKIKTMIFSFKKYNATYFRVPKVASTSLLISFRQIDEVEKCDEYDRSSFKFAFVRNPFDRIASCFRHVIQKGSLQGIQGHSKLHSRMSFEDFLDVVEETEIKNMDIHFRPQYTFIPETPDFIGKFEDLNEDYAKIIQKIGIKPAPELPHENKTAKTIYKDYYNSSTIKKVLNIYKKDFELFGYQKDITL